MDGQKPNIVFILMDNLGYGEVGSYGSGLIVLSWEGAIFTAAALDPNGTATDNNIGDAFQDGVLVVAEGRITIKPFGLVGHPAPGGRVEQQGAYLAPAGIPSEHRAGARGPSSFPA